MDETAEEMLTDAEIEAQIINEAGEQDSMDEIAKEIPTDAEIEAQINEAGEQARVSPLDPDFLIFALPIALIVDVLDIILEIAGVAVIPKLVGIILDVLTFIIIIGWIHWRTKKIEKSKRARQIALQKTAQKGIRRLKKLQKIGKVSDKVFGRYMRRFGERMGKGGRLIAKMARKPLGRTLTKGSLVLLGEIVWLIGLIPFWTIAVVSTLRKK